MQCGNENKRALPWIFKSDNEVLTLYLKKHKLSSVNSRIYLGQLCAKTMQESEASRNAMTEFYLSKSTLCQQPLSSYHDDLSSEHIESLSAPDVFDERSITTPCHKFVTFHTADFPHNVG